MAVIDSILVNRAATSPIPTIMSDALSSNKQTAVAEAIQTLCNSHARRKFVDVISHFPDEVEHILERYGKIWTNEHETQDLNLTPAERLAYHHKHSLPIMEEIEEWGKAHLRNDTVEENSGLGKAICYFTVFCSCKNCISTIHGGH